MPETDPTDEFKVLPPMPTLVLSGRAYLLLQSVVKAHEGFTDKTQIQLIAHDDKLVRYAIIDRVMYSLE